MVKMILSKLKQKLKPLVKRDGVVYNVADTIYNTVNNLGRVKQGLGTLPNFIIIGAQKAGTSSLYHYLCQHPKIKGACRKEISYFNSPHYGNINWYKSFFPISLFSQNFLTGEASTSYMFYPWVADRIKATLPDVKIIVMIRDPIKRAFSDYQHEVRAGREPLTFEEALHAEQERIYFPRKNSNKYKTRSKTVERYSYASAGLYYSILKHWYETFPKEQILLVDSDAFFGNPGKETGKVFAFLDLTPFPLKHYPNVFPGGYTSKPSQTAIKYLRNYYAKNK